MSNYQLILAFLIGILLSHSLQSFSKVLLVTRKRDKNFWLGLTLLAGSIYILMQLLLSQPASETTLILMHRIKLFSLLCTVSGWMYILYNIYFPNSKYTTVFTILCAGTALLIPFSFFMDAPINRLDANFLGIQFTYHFGTTGPAYLIMSVLILVPFSLIPISRFLLACKMPLKERIIGAIVFSPGVVGGLNDFAVTNRVYEGVMISEYVFFIFLAGVSMHLFREDAENYSLLQNINYELEAKISHRTLELETANHKLQAMAATDLLTGLCNRREFTHLLSREEDRTKRYGMNALYTFSVLFIDLDNFKYYNDTFGHAVGDHVLSAFASLLKKILRSPDTAARYGGDEFVALLPNTNQKGAMTLASRILDELKSKSGFEKEISETICQDSIIPSGKRLSCSIGLVTYDTTTLGSCDQILIAADQALYSAKAAGKGCIKVWQKDEGQNLSRVWIDNTPTP